MPENNELLPKSIDATEFEAIIGDLTAGKRVSDQEMVDAIWYSHDHLPAVRSLSTALVSGWRKAMNRIDQKNNRIGRLERQLNAARRFINQQGGKK